jgi:predicted membrane channel-forming protein YqfA (hemolysin III family)
LLLILSQIYTLSVFLCLIIISLFHFFSSQSLVYASFLPPTHCYQP